MIAEPDAEKFDHSNETDCPKKRRRMVSPLKDVKFEQSILSDQVVGEPSPPLEVGKAPSENSESVALSTPQLREPSASPSNSPTTATLAPEKKSKRAFENRFNNIQAASRALLGVVTADPTSLPRLLGEGTYAKVFSVRVEEGVFVACKNLVDDKGARETRFTLQETVMEARIHEFVTKNLIAPSYEKCDARTPSCPNFVALLRHDAENSRLCFSSTEPIKRKKTPRCVSAMYMELCYRSNFYEFLDNCKPCENEAASLRLAASLFGQLCMATLALGSISVTHNDLRFSNFLLASTETPEDGLLYCIPSSGEEESDEGTYIRLPGGTGIPFVAMTDFGISSSVEWKTDPRFFGMSGTRGDMLARLFYGPDEGEGDNTSKSKDESDCIDNKDFERLSLSSHGDTLGAFRPLTKVKVGEYERDFATVFTLLEDMKTDDPVPRWVFHLQQMAKHAIDELSRVRPTNSAQQRAVIINVFRTCPLLEGVVEQNRPPLADERVWRIPNAKEGRSLARQLSSALSAPITKGNQFLLTT